MPGSYWRYKKAEEVKDIISQCAGLFTEATTNSRYAVTGDTMAVSFTINKQNNCAVTLNKIELDSYDTTLHENLSTNENVTINTGFLVRNDKPLYQPYWLASDHMKGSFIVNDQLQVGKAENDPDYSATFFYTIDGTTFRYQRPLQYKYADAIKGEIYEPVRVITPFAISAMPSIVLLNVQPRTGTPPSPELKIIFRTNITASQLPVTVKAVQNDKVIFLKDTVINAEAGKDYIFFTGLKKIITNRSDSSISVAITVKKDGTTKTYTNYLRTIHYDHIPDISYNYVDNVRVVSDEIKTSGKTIGYITGAGDKMPQALQQMGYTVKLLTESDITPTNLTQFDAVIAGIRAYNVLDWLPAKYDILMNYINGGGNYIVQYNQQNVVTRQIGPYPFTISRTRVTDENADVHFLLPNSSVLNFPNKIAASDFKNWIQERSIYQAENVDTHYTAPIGMHDPNEAETNGSLIMTAYGKGNFIYTGLVFFREMPAGIGGSYRLMANLIALPKNK